MREAVKDHLENSGINVSEALERFMGNDVLLVRFLKKFLSDPNYEKLVAAIDSGNQEAAFVAAHTLKGVSGNLAMTRLFALLSEQVEAFRAGDWASGTELMLEITKEYETAAAAIRSLG